MPTIYYDEADLVVAGETEARDGNGYVVYDAGGTNPVRVDLSATPSATAAGSPSLLAEIDLNVTTFDVAFVQANPPQKIGDYYRVTTTGPDNTPFTGNKLYLNDEIVARIISGPLTADSSDWYIRAGNTARTAVQADVDDVVDFSTDAPADRLIWSPRMLQLIQEAGDAGKLFMATGLPAYTDYKFGDYLVPYTNYYEGMLFFRDTSQWLYIGQMKIPFINYNLDPTNIAALMTFPQLYYWVRIDADGGSGDDLSGIYVVSAENEVSGPFALNPTNPANTITNTAP